MAILVPVIIGLLLGKEALAGVLVGSLVSGLMLGIQTANSGGAMDNAKKYIEEGHFGGRVRSAQGGRHRRYRWRSAEGYRGTVDQHSDQIDGGDFARDGAAVTHDRAAFEIGITRSSTK
jgi:hypothetical protein